MMCDDISNTMEREAKGRKKIEKKQRRSDRVVKKERRELGEFLFRLDDYKTSLITYSVLFVQRKSSVFSAV